MPAKIRILFVDDEPRILRGLRRKLTAFNEPWELAFAESGPEALEILRLAKEPFDAIVTDMRMPDMNGVELLQAVKQQYPQITRIILSGHADRQSVLQAMGLTHQYLSKPCDTELLKDILNQTFVLRELLASDDLKRLLSHIETLPSLPALYQELKTELESSNASIKRIGQIISQDIGMATKILQLANSALFNPLHIIADPTQAVIFLGLDVVKALALSIQVFSQFDPTKLGPLSLSALQGHSLVTGILARQITQAENADKQLIEQAFTAGLLHDVGKLVLATNLPREYKATLALMSSLGVTLTEAEYELFGASHAEVGAYLLGLWGLPKPIIEALAFHHNPRQSLKKEFSPLTAVHVANALVYEANPSARAASPIDTAYLAELKLTDRLPQWRKFYQETYQEKKTDEREDPLR